MSTLLFKYKKPITKHKAATPIGYQSPTNGSLVKLVDNNVAIKGTNPPNAKEKQGELFVEKMETSVVDTTAMATAVK